MLKLECWLEFEQHAARKMAAKTQDWKWARACYKASYLIHDKHRYELEHAVAELDMDLKTLKSRLNPTAAAAVVFPKGRVKFLKPDGTSGAPLQGQAILYFGSNATLFKDKFEQYGRCWQ